MEWNDNEERNRMKDDGMKICCSFESISDEDEGEIEVAGWWRFQDGWELRDEHMKVRRNRIQSHSIQEEQRMRWNSLLE